MKPLIVVKIGTSTIVHERPSGESFNRHALRSIATQITQLQRDGYHVVVVSSAAITGGMLATRQTVRPSRRDNVPELQRLASIGWRAVLNEWQQAFGDILIGEMLLTRHSLSLDHERQEALRLIRSLLDHGDLPIINENDSVAHEEIAFGDNDTLAAIVSAKLASSPLFHDEVHFVTLSDIDGVYRDVNDPSSIIDEIESIDDYQHVIGDTVTTYGTGGMTTKFRAAQIATEAGVTSYIVNGAHPTAIADAIARRAGTRFVASD